MALNLVKSMEDAIEWNDCVQLLLLNFCLSKTLIYAIGGICGFIAVVMFLGRSLIIKNN